MPFLAHKAPAPFSSLVPVEIPSAIVARAEQALRNNGYALLKEIRCTFHEGILVLHGQLPSFFLKQLAQSCVIGLPGVVQVLNRTEVVSPRE